ncbi:hypothetical protein EV121DRAFT_251857, partial [Schizophyllum commune]
MEHSPYSSDNHSNASDTSNMVIQYEPPSDPSKLVHPLFNSPDADVVLASKNGTKLFRVHSWTLRTTSGFFREMLSLPQQGQAGPSSPGPHGETMQLYLDEDEKTLDALLRMVCGLPLLPIDTHDLADGLLYAAEKYDMPGPLSIVRLVLQTAPLAMDPLRLYAAACRFGWESEAKTASTQTLTYNLHDPIHRPALQRLSTTAVLDLFALHRARREGLRKRMNEPPFVHGGVSPCVSCQRPIDYHTWRELKYKIIIEMDVRPLGDTIINEGLQDWPEATACWQAKCMCDRFLYDKVETLRVIKDCIEGLPKSIC